MRLVRIGWALPLAMALFSEVAHAQSLREIFLLALSADPGLASNEAQYRGSEERVREARAAILPNVSLSETGTISRFSPDGQDNRIRDFHSTHWGVQITQPLYKPESTSALDESKAEREAAQAQLDAAESDLAVRVATAYFDTLSAREIVLSLDRDEKATLQQMASARRSFEVGTVAITDVLDAESKHDVIVAQKEAAENDLMLKREALKQLIGGAEYELSVLPQNAGDPELTSLNTDLHPLIAEALERNPVARQAMLQWEASNIGVNKAQRGHLPTLDLIMSYGSDQSVGTPANPTEVHGNTAQAQVNFTFPIFAGFGTDAKIGEAAALRDKSTADLEAAEHTVATHVREAFYGLKSALRQIAALHTAEKSTAAAVRAQLKGYRVGTSMTADVLKAESLFSQAHRDLMKAKIDARLNRIKLQIALGRPWRESVDEVARLLVPERLVMAEEDSAPSANAKPATVPSPDTTTDPNKESAKAPEQ